MKRYQLLILLAIVFLSLVSLVSCGESERDKAVTFYQGAYTISREMKQVDDDWKALLQEFSKRKVSNQEIISQSQECTTRFEAISKDLSTLYAPLPLRQIKDGMASAINLRIEWFSLYQQYVITNDMRYSIEGDLKLMECHRLLMRIADKWDDGLTYYNIKLSEIIPKP